MKKIWFLTGLLLLLIILCVATKLSSIRTTQTHRTVRAVASSQHLASSRPIEFDIRQQGNIYSLRGRFKDTAQQQRLTEAFSKTSHSLQIGDTSTNQTLAADEVIGLAEAIIPHFAKHYENGGIYFHNNMLTVDGMVHSYAEKREMERLLSGTTVPTQDNTVVILPHEPISFRIDNTNGTLAMRGIFHDAQQAEALVHCVPQGIRADRISESSTYVDSEGAIPFVKQMLPLFSEQFDRGYIQYKDHRFVITGFAKDRAALDHMKSLLAQSKIPVVDQTRINPAVLQKIAKEEAARLARQKAEAQAQETARLKIEAEAKAAAKAQEAAQKIAIAAKEAEQRRLLRVKKMQQEAQAAKENIAKLLKIENIEFEVAKGTLTPKGRQTVNKLAVILKKYPDIRVEIAGHTDSDGNADFNQRLSQARVDTVRSALIQQGIAATRLEAVGYGETKPLVPNTGPENKQKNRRVEINIIGE